MPEYKFKIFCETILGIFFTALIVAVPILTNIFPIKDLKLDNSYLIGNFITLLAGLGGAVLGAFVTGRVTGSHARSAKKDKQEAELFKVMIKASLIQTDFVNLKNEIEESVKNANANGLSKMPNWAKVQANPGDFEKISIAPEDLVCLFSAREFDLISGLVEIAMKHTKLIDAFNVYSKLRGELKDHMPKDEISGPVVSSNLNKADRLRLAPRFLELDFLLTSIEKLLPIYVEESRSVCSKIGPAGRKYFNDPKFPTIK